jgi:hypothetical protein
MIDARSVALALGGEVAGRNTILAPGPGHSRKDRSLAVRLDQTAPSGFLVFSHAGDDWKTCRDYVRRTLGLPDWAPGDEQNRTIPQRVNEGTLRRVDYPHGRLYLETAWNPEDQDYLLKGFIEQRWYRWMWTSLPWIGWMLLPPVALFCVGTAALWVARGFKA